MIVNGAQDLLGYKHSSKNHVRTRPGREVL